MSTLKVHGVFAALLAGAALVVAPAYSQTPGGTPTDQQTTPPPSDGSGQQPGDTDNTDTEVEITDEQSAEIRTIISEGESESVEADFDVTIGVAVPSTIRLLPLPPRVVQLVPAYEGYMYFVLADGRIIIVEPDTHEIVYIVAA